MCPYLNPKSGCTLDSNDKPFDCKIWPLRLMRNGDEIVIALSPICPALPISKREEIVELLDSGLRKEILKHVDESDLIKEYRSDWTIL